MAKKRTKKNKGESALFCYVTEDNADFARWHGRKKYGSYSKYVDHLITRDRSKNARPETPRVE